jgi:hypothetical protein
MRWLTTIVVTGLFFQACHSPAYKEAVPAAEHLDKIPNQSDTFAVRDLFKEPSVMRSVPLDSVYKRDYSERTGVEITLPRASAGYPSVVRNRLNRIFRDKIEEYQESVREIAAELKDTNAIAGWWGFIGPVNIYRNAHTLSYILEDNSGFSGMKSLYSFIAINYNLKTGKEINLADYFILDRPADSAFLADIICKSVKWQNTEEAKSILSYEPIVFGFDQENVYFFFDRAHILPVAGQIGSVRKKYLINHIRPEYRIISENL